jgi:ATP/maltotriose-dependent transcriptional regulator MalT
MVTLAGGVFVGRQQEMGKLKGVLENALSGQGQLLMLVGEPGIGKTRTAQELAAHAEIRGARVLWGWCYEEEGAPPFWPWVQPIRAYVQQRDSEQLQSEMGPGAADIAEVISKVRDKLPNLELAPALPPEQARFRLFNSITTFLKGAAQSQPLMLVLDDLHWADKPSLLLLQFLARQLTESQLLVVGCYRDLELSRQHPLSEVLAQLSRLPVFQRELLLGISQEDTGRFIEMTAGIRPSAQLVGTIYAHTEGNPFFLKEMTRLLSERGELRAAEIVGPEGIRIPQGVREVIGQRLNRLSESCHQTLTIASIIGREFDFRLLRTLSGETTEDQLLEVIDEALEARVVEGSSGGREHYRFSHALIQQTLAEELSTSRKVRWHARIGEALEGLYGIDGEAHAAELAYHFAQAVTVSGPEKIVQYSLLAGEQALASYAWEEALQHFQQGLASRGVSLEGTEPARDAEEAAMLLGLGRTQACIAERRYSQDALASLCRAFDYYETTKDIAGIVVTVESVPRSAFGQSNGFTELLTRALALVQPDSQKAGRLLTLSGAERGRIEADYNGAQVAFGQALALARRIGDVGLEVRVLAESASTDFAHHRQQGCLEKSLRVISLTSGLDEPRAELHARRYAGTMLLQLGELEESIRHTLASMAPASKLRDPYSLATACFANEMVFSAKGDWQAARDFGNRGLEASAWDTRLLAPRVLLEYQVGEFSQGAVYLHRLLEVIRQYSGPTLAAVSVAQIIPLVVRITGSLDRLDIAQTVAEMVLSSPFAAPFLSLEAKTGLAMAAVVRNDVLAARQGYLALEPYSGTMLSPLISVSADRLLGLLAQTMGQIDQAEVHLGDALAFCRKAGFRPELAWSCYDNSDLLLARDHPGDHDRAMSSLEEALTLSTELGMRPLMERVHVLWEQAKVQPARVPAYPNGLTHREVEVLRLVTTGKTDREIAEALSISVTTVSTHVRNILNKINAANRTEATAYSAQHGLL